jgi:hypothetical protein
LFSPKKDTFAQRFECLKVKLPTNATNLSEEVENVVRTARICNATLTSLLTGDKTAVTSSENSSIPVSASIISPTKEESSSSSSSASSEQIQLLCQESADFLYTDEFDPVCHSDSEIKPKNCEKENKTGRARVEWTEKEDLIFMEGLMLYGKNYEQIAKSIGTRNRAQVTNFSLNLSIVSFRFTDGY